MLKRMIYLMICLMTAMVFTHPVYADAAPVPGGFSMLSIILVLAVVLVAVILLKMFRR